MKLNKLLTLALVGACMGMVSCKKKDNKPTEPAEVTATLGIGYSAKYEDKNPNGLLTVTGAAVAFDAEGKIVACYLDEVQEYVNTGKVMISDQEKDTLVKVDTYTAKGKVGLNQDGTFKTKKELHDDYGMYKNQADAEAFFEQNQISWYGSTKAEFYTQIAAFENACLGKTAAEVVALAEVANVTIQIDDFKNAVKTAYDNKKSTSFTCEEGFDIKVGMMAGLYSTSHNAAYDEISCELAAVVSVGGAVVDSALDVVVAVPNMSKVTELLTTGNNDAIKYHADASVIKSKLTLGDAYAMYKDGKTNPNWYGSKLAEWDDQAIVIQNACVGKTAAQIQKLVKQGQPEKQADQIEITGCTITIDNLTAAIVKGIK